MDIQMPEMDGYTATKIIREWEKKNNRKHTHIIALSAYALKEEVKKSLNAGCDDHITKPIKKKKLMETILKYSVYTQKDLKEDKKEEKIELNIDPDIEDLIPGYINNRKKDIKKINQALDEKNFELIERLGHSMKGSGGGYGLDKISKIGKIIEYAGKNKDTKEILNALEKLKSFIIKVEEFYEREF